MPITMLTQIIVANVAISLVSLLGGITILWKKLIDKAVIPYLVSFAAGVILTTAFLDIFPEALEAAEGTDLNIFIPAFGGLLTSFFIERFLLWFHHHEHTHGLHPTTLLITIGDGVHNFIDGLTIAATYLTNPALGLITTVAIAAHEIPQEIADFGVLVHSGMKKRDALALNFLSAGFAVAGGVGGYFFLNHFAGVLPVLLAFSAGIFIYIASSDLIPDLHRDFKEQRRWTQVIPFILGILLMYAMITILHE